MDRYFRNAYNEHIDFCTVEKRYIYAHYNSLGQWEFKDYDGSVLVNLCFNDRYYTKLDAIYDIYKGVYCDEITKEQYENLK